MIPRLYLNPEKWFESAYWTRQELIEIFGLDMVRLNLGCGYPHTQYEGYVNIDIVDFARRLDLFPECEFQPFMVFDCSEKLPFRDGEVDEIYTSSMIEHFPWWTIKEMLEDWYQVLTAGGTLKIVTSDFEYMIREEYLRRDEGGLTMGIIHDLYGERIDEGVLMKQEAMRHKMVFDHHLLKQFLEEAGFRDVQRTEFNVPKYPASPNELIVECRK